MLALAKTNHNAICYKVYSDGSGFEGGAGVSAVMCMNNREIKSLHLYLSPSNEHTVYESELIGLLLALYLLTNLIC